MLGYFFSFGILSGMFVGLSLILINSRKRGRKEHRKAMSQFKECMKKVEMEHEMKKSPSRRDVKI